jgi:ribonuclease HII
MTVAVPCRLAGVDEAGRGPLAGPVVAAAVILDPSRPVAGLDDSKKLSARRRVTLAEEIRERALSFAIARADAAEIDVLNILGASLLAMRRALLGLAVLPTHVEVDGKHVPDLCFGRWSVTGRAIVGGDSTVAAISAASILAKVARDRMMCRLDQAFPEYGFARHKGYGTAEHRNCLLRIGPCPQHRLSFRPLSDMAGTG